MNCCNTEQDSLLAKSISIFFWCLGTHLETITSPSLCVIMMLTPLLYITLYTNEHTKSMKPHCILGNCSAQFLSIIGWGRQSGEFQNKSQAEKPKNKEYVKGREGRGYEPYNWLLVQDTSLQVSLFPKFSSYHQSHLTGNRQEEHWMVQVNSRQKRNKHTPLSDFYLVLHYSIIFKSRFFAHFCQSKPF